MARIFTKLCILAALGTMAATAGGRNFGLGIVLPSPTGLSAKYWTSGTTALDFVVGWSRGYHSGYTDGNCYNDAFYRANRGYCNDRAYDWRDGDGRYYYGDRYRGWRTFHFHADYLMHNFNLIRASEKFPIYYGPGLNLEYFEYNDLLLGVRGNFGIAWLPRRAPMDVFFEVAPVVNLFPEPFFNVNVGLGTRFYF